MPAVETGSNRKPGNPGNLEKTENFERPQGLETSARKTNTWSRPASAKTPSQGDLAPAAKLETTRWLCVGDSLRNKNVGWNSSAALFAEANCKTPPAKKYWLRLLLLRIVNEETGFQLFWQLVERKKEVRVGPPCPQHVAIPCVSLSSFVFCTCVPT